MRSRKSALFWLLKKEWRELLSSRAWWMFLLLMGPLTGISFIGAVRTYAEASGLNGTSTGTGEAFSPLIGIWAPTFSACELAATFLLPFVVIRLVAGDRQSGALKIESQHPMTGLARISVKMAVLLCGWTVASLAPLIAVALWMSYGGSVYPPELATVALGHLLNAGLMLALAAVAASVTEHPSTAAILTLTMTVGSWIVNFIAAVQGGPWETIAGYTPTTLIAEFQHGLLRLDLLLIAITLIVAGLALAAVWLRIGVAVRRRTFESLALAACAAALIFCCAQATASRDTSENRMNSFSRADERALRRIDAPLSIEAHLAPEDPRRVDLEHRTISKLRRLLPGLRVHYISRTSIGLFEQNTPHYGEIWYELNGRKAMSRGTTPEGALETIYSLAGIAPPDNGDDVFRGHPLAAGPRGAAAMFYLVWPALVAACAWIAQARQKR